MKTLKDIEEHDCLNHVDRDLLKQEAINRNYEVPLIYTFSWNYYEYWCPYCDTHEGMMGAGENVEETKELKKRLKLFEEVTKDYIHAMGVLGCFSTKWKEEQIKPEDLPKEEKDRLQTIRDKGWELNKKVEDLK